ncbi:MAG: hypothetical protein JO175_05145 [Candidatus Eremiobacteraeota bacterium]|nr:hypothetical protein [Candidatus Eremiobacteraeota bacterium]
MSAEGVPRRRRLGALAVVAATVLALIVTENVLAAAYLNRIERFSTDFSSTFLLRRIQALKASGPEVVFMGDSSLWGYGLPPGSNAVAILAAEGCPCANLAFKAGSPPNYYALALLLQAAGYRPKLVVLEINQPAFNPADQGYATLHPGLATVARPLLDRPDWVALGLSTAPSSLPAEADRWLSSLWLVYGARADLRASILGDTDVVPKEPPPADAFLGTYDLAPLDERNTGVHYLEKTADLLRRQGIPAVAFFTPTNHALLHEYIDVPEYASNGRYIAHLLERRGVAVIDLDRAFPAADFIDNTHFTKQGQRRLAAVLARRIPALGVAQVSALPLHEASSP